MPLLSAYQDFVQHTLTRLGDVWKKISFVVELRTPAGEYHHWGLEHEHGPAEAQKALERSHHELVMELVAQPISEIVRKTEDPQELARLSAAAICPEELPECVRRHVDYTVETTKLIVAGQNPSGHRVA